MNKWAEIAAVLGVELNEEFTVKDYCAEYVITAEGLKVRYPTLNEKEFRWTGKDEVGLEDIIDNADKIIKKPWVPKDGESTWYWSILSQRVVNEPFNVHYTPDIFRWKLGLLFRTKEGAETKGKADAKALLEEYKASLEE